MGCGRVAEINEGRDDYVIGEDSEGGREEGRSHLLYHARLTGYLQTIVGQLRETKEERKTSFDF